jgi:hypothetical protein
MTKAPQPSPTSPSTTASPTTPPPRAVFDIWEEIAQTFKAHQGLKVGSVWLTGMSSRVSAKRLSKLRSTKQAESLTSTLSDLPKDTIKALRTFAAINQEQVVASFRITMIGNVTIPIGLLAVFHQILPKGLGATILEFYDDRATLSLLAITSLICVFFIMIVALYALANLNQARDIRHLIDLYAAERGIYFGLEDMDDLNLH